MTNDKYNFLNKYFQDYYKTNGLIYGNASNKFTDYLANGMDFDTALRTSGLKLNNQQIADLRNIHNASINNANDKSWQQIADQYNKNSKTNNGLGIAGSVIGGVNALTNMGLGIFGAIQANREYQMAKEKFDMEKQLINRNLANQANLVNSQVASAANLSGLYSKDYSKGYNDYYNKYSVNGNPVG